MHRDHRGWGLWRYLRDSRVTICGTLGSLVRLWVEIFSRRPRGLRRYFWKRREERRQRKNKKNHKKKKNIGRLIVGRLGRFLKGLSDVQGESHGAEARSPFQGRNGTAPTGEAVSRKDTFLRPYAAFAKVMFLPGDEYTWKEIPPRAANKFDYFGSAVVSRGVNRTLLRATGTCSKNTFPKK